MIRKNNIHLIEDFLKSDDKNLLINQVSDEIGCFYQTVVKEISKGSGIQILYRSDIEIDNSEDLFGAQKIYIYASTNSKQIEEITKKNRRGIILTDYKTYKKYQKSLITINGYQFKEDLKYFLKIINIDNTGLYSYCLSLPHLAFSEISKYKINNLNYSSDPVINGIDNFVLNIRKDIYKLKKSDINLKQLFDQLKREVKYKKFSFLTY